ncbi:hypothetical protein MLD38_038045 [Melastoma candidum]|uniref:Uncharacterized protein n=1 Tax=Melastoma candidum TaxID=119954 RepID=A0ACB9KZ41_9MYRT|nr:hypothetical protein MLD38_038045 [Melastoma candidum]
MPWVIQGERCGAKLYAGISFMEEGIVDEHFIMPCQLKERSGPRYFVETISQFCTNTKASIVLMTVPMQPSILDYYSPTLHQDQGELLQGKMAKNIFNSVCRCNLVMFTMFRLSPPFSFECFGCGNSALCIAFSS